MFETEDEAYSVGLNAGKTWDRPWMPGGPYVPSTNHTIRSDPEWVAHCVLAEKIRASWLSGFKIGLTAERK